MKKATIQLSMNFLVTLILAIVMFSLGMVIIYRMVDNSRQAGQNFMPDSVKSSARSCANRGEKVCVLGFRKEFETDQNDFFYVAVNNIIGEQKEFQVLTEFSLGQEKDSGATVNDLDGFSGSNEVDWVNPSQSPFPLGNQEYQIESIPMHVPKNIPDGTYTFNIYVCMLDDTSNTHPKCPGSASLYHPTEQINVIVD